jgi:glycosyltransferase involved in cell wall biosynthesis
LRIGIAINTSWNIYNFRRNLVQELQLQGHQLYAIAPRDDYSQYLVDWGCVFEELPMQATNTNPIEDLVLIWKFRQIFRRRKLDLVLSYTIKPNIYGSIATAGLPTKIICNVSGLGTTFLTSGLSSMIAHWLYGISFRLSDHIFFQNEEDRVDFRRKINLNLSKTSLLPGSGIDLDKYKPEGLPCGKRTVFLMVARVIVEKGVREYAAAALALLNERQDVEFRLVGGFDPDHSRSIVQSEIEEWMKGGLIVKGHSDRINEEMLAADVVVLPSYREGTPRTLLEGAALGRPLIASDVAGCRETVADGKNGYLCKVKDADSLLQVFRTFSDLPLHQRQSMGAESRKLVETKFDVRLVIEEYKRVIDRLTS